MSAPGEAVAASSTSTLCWLDAEGRPRARGVVALVRGGRPVVAFPYADEEVAREVASSRTVVLDVTEPRSTGHGFSPLRITGRAHLVEDRTGDVFVADLLVQELRKYPPARVFADSPLLMREHWWYLPRLLVEVEVDSLEPVAPRADGCDHLLVVAQAGAPVVRPVGVGADTGRELVVDPGIDVAGPVPGPGPALVFGQDASYPDLERWQQWRWTGTWDGTTGFVVDERPERTGLGPAPSLVQRWRRQRSLERHCVRALSRART